MSNLFYHKDLTEALPESFSTLFCGYSKADGVDAIYPPVTVIGTVFITSSASGAPSVCLSDCYNS